jgi:hypothetical protein
MVSRTGLVYIAVVMVAITNANNIIPQVTLIGSRIALILTTKKQISQPLHNIIKTINQINREERRI